MPAFTRSILFYYFIFWSAQSIIIEGRRSDLGFIDFLSGGFIFLFLTTLPVNSPSYLVFLHISDMNENEGLNGHDEGLKGRWWRESEVGFRTDPGTAAIVLVLAKARGTQEQL